MKLLLFVDLHGSTRALKELKEKAKNVDAVVCAGDITIFQERMDSLLLALNSLKNLF